MKTEVRNRYKVNLDDIETGKLFYYFHDSKFHQVLIGEGVVLENMYVDIGDDKRMKVSPSELYTEVPDDWSGSVINF